MSALWHHEQHRLGLAAVGFEHEGVRMSKSAPCSPMKAQSRPHDSLGGLLAGFEANGGAVRETNDFHVMHKVPMGDSPYVRAKHVQLVDKDPEKAIALFWKAINANDRVDSALKDMAIVMKQQGRSEEAIEAIKSLRIKCSEAAQESLDNVLLDLYKRCGRLDDQIELLKHKLNLIHQGLAFNGKRTKTARSQGKKFQVSIEQEATRLLGNLGWAYMQQNNFLAAEAVYRKALSIEPDNNKMCNLGICLMKQARIDEARAILNNVTPAGEGKWGSESHQKSFERAQEMLREIEATQAGQSANDAEAKNRASWFAARAPTLVQLQQRKNAQPELQSVADALRAILSDPGFAGGLSAKPVAYSQSGLNPQPGFNPKPVDVEEELLSLLPPSRTVTPPVFALPEDLTSPPEGERPASGGEHPFAAPVPRQPGLSHRQVAPQQQPGFQARPMSAPLQRQNQPWRQSVANPPQKPKPNSGFSYAAPPFVPHQKAGGPMSWGPERQPLLPPPNEHRCFNGPHPMGPPPPQKPLNRAAVHTSPLRPPTSNVNAPPNLSGQTAFPQTAHRYAQNVNRPQAQGINGPQLHSVNRSQGVNGPQVQNANRPPHEKSPAAKALFAQPPSNQRYGPPTAGVKTPQPAVDRYGPPPKQTETVQPKPAQPERAISAPVHVNGGSGTEENLLRATSAPEQTIEPLSMPQPIRSVLGPRFSREGSREHLGGVTRVSSPSKVNSPRRSFERLPSSQPERAAGTRSALYHSTSLPSEIDERPWESDHENENIPQDAPNPVQQGPAAAGVKRNRVLTPVKDNQKQPESENNAWQSLGFSASPLSFPKEGPPRGKGMFMAVLEAAAAKESGKGSPVKGGSPQMKVEPKRQRRLRVFEEIAQEGM
ncbi:tetratricopeptide repeat domain containing protein [Klebsormidium nitens]|uniref:Tetratricopeptide repeat domain containing protein n=1 Tax=Klebsormidium nitens TaxID=105231 RepID=A0A1Y1INI2_KLENI|nr:tetratricopeptide repeat domain containing protein [Klebsormidium nitens]|eukprot:GAQ92294.1 tetratricopeptide repeat domain containing protein [Klebsormidium nitens]